MLGYIILRVDGNDRYVIAIEPSKKGKDDYVVLGYEWVHWDTLCCGEFPHIDNTIPWIDTRTYDIKRRSGYIMESDEAYLRYKGQVEDGITDATAKLIWTDTRTPIRIKYPKP